MGGDIRQLIGDDIDMSSGRGITPESSTTDFDQVGPHDRVIALCRHERAGALPHHDLFLGPEKGEFTDEERVLQSWRLPRDLRELAPGSTMEIEPIGMHRGLYARLEAPRELDQQRGRVTQIASGRARVASLSSGVLVLRIAWSDGTHEILALEPARGGGLQLLKRAPGP